MFIEKDDVAMDLMTAGESGSGLGSILDFCAGAAALLLGFVIAAALPPVTLAVLRKKYNQADGTPDRSAKEMLHAHKGAAKLCMLHKAVFVIAGALVWGMAFAEQVLHLLAEDTPLYNTLDDIWSAAAFVLAATGMVLMIGAITAAERAKMQKPQMVVFNGHQICYNTDNIMPQTGGRKGCIMKRIYITAIPLDSNFSISRYAAEPANYRPQKPVRPYYYPITPVIADTARQGDEIKVIAVRQKNSPHSENLEIFRRELDGLGLPCALTDLTTPENQQRDGLLALFEALTGEMESDACYYADATFGTKTYPLVLSSALHYAEKILDEVEVCGIYYRELTREDGKVKSVQQYDISALFTLDGIVDMAAEDDLPDKKKFIRMMLHPDREV